LTETVADLSDAPFTGGVIVNRVILMAVLAFLLIVSTTASAYVVGTLYFPRDTVDLNGREIKTFLAEQPLTMFDHLFGTSTYFNELKDEEKLKAFYKDTLIDIAMLTSLDPMISLFSSCYTIIKWTGTDLDDVAEGMKTFCRHQIMACIGDWILVNNRGRMGVCSKSREQEKSYKYVWNNKEVRI